MSRRYDEREPTTGPYQQTAVSFFLAAVAEGQSVTSDPASNESDGLCSSIPLIALFVHVPSAIPITRHHTAHTRLASRESSVAGDSASFFRQVKETVEMLQSGPLSLSHSLASAYILRRVVLEGAAALEVQGILDELLVQQRTAPIAEIGRRLLSSS